MNAEPGCPPGPGCHQVVFSVAGTAVITSLVKIFPKLSMEDRIVADFTNEGRISTLEAPRSAWRRGWD